MALNLHDACKARLLQVLSDELPEVMVDNRMFLSRKSAIRFYPAEDIVPSSGEIREWLNNYISDIPVSEFFFETLSRDLFDNQDYQADEVGSKLTDLPGCEDAQTVAVNLIEKLDSLPWNYSFSLRLPSELSGVLDESLKDYSFSDYLKLVKVDEQFRSRFPIPIDNFPVAKGEGLAALARVYLDPWDGTDKVVLQVNREGFIGKYGLTETYIQVEELIRAFFGLGIALRLFKIDRKYQSTPQKAEIYIHKIEGEAWSFQQSQEIDASKSESINDLTIHDLNGKLDSEAKKQFWIQDVLADIGMVFEFDSKTKKLILASQWLFDSYCGKDELLAFIQSTVVIEILLGDKAESDVAGLGVLLRNRCAYLIGASQTQREEVLKDFQEIYDVRSRIVHGGKNRLNRKERKLLTKLQWMSRRIIQEEVRLLKEDTSED
ncbi:hypothetical protein ACCI51_12040 [Microbulbifer echini]|uniref:Apea-like HEPN domain-containing protein n=1 Tax=Microbulbifer echini TaxID=1529067 RepID=A0ABV4NP11_9GAMM